MAETSKKRKQLRQKYCLTKMSAAIKARCRGIREKNLDSPPSQATITRLHCKYEADRSVCELSGRADLQDLNVN